MTSIALFYVKKLVLRNCRQQTHPFHNHITRQKICDRGSADLLSELLAIAVALVFYACTYLSSFVGSHWRVCVDESACNTALQGLTVLFAARLVVGWCEVRVRRCLVAHFSSPESERKTTLVHREAKVYIETIRFPWQVRMCWLFVTLSGIVGTVFWNVFKKVNGPSFDKGGV